MRTVRSLVYLSSLLAISLLSTSCATEVPATITRHSPVPLAAKNGIVLMASRQRDLIQRSLESAGLKVSDEWTGENYTLTVKLGSSRSSSDCGTVQNVVYKLAGAGQRRSLIVIKGRGATGDCETNIFNDMSRKLATQFTAK